MQIMCIVVFSIYSKSWVHSEPFAQLALSPWTTWKLHLGKRGKPVWEDGQGLNLLRSTEQPCSCSCVQSWGGAALWFLSWWLPLGIGHGCLSGNTDFFPHKKSFCISTRSRAPGTRTARVRASGTCSPRWLPPTSFSQTREYWESTNNTESQLSIQGSSSWATK